jgi:hypothetical protein
LVSELQVPILRWLPEDVLEVGVDEATVRLILTKSMSGMKSLEKLGLRTDFIGWG